MWKLLIALLLLTGCATEFQPKSFNGGYIDRMTGPNTAIVTFSGNEFTDQIRAQQFALRRAAILTTENGFDYFMTETTQDKIHSHTSPGTTRCSGRSSGGFGGYGSTSINTSCRTSPGFTSHEPESTIRIRMFKGETPNEPHHYDARYLANPDLYSD